MAILLVDDNGMPIPQYTEASTGNFAASKGVDGALLVKLTDVVDGVLKMRLVTTTGDDVQITREGIPVFLSSPEVQQMIWNGTQWVRGGVAKVLTIVPSGAYTSSQTSIVISNNGAQNGFLAIDITGNPVISKAEIHIKVGQQYVKYKDINFTAVTGANIVTFGKDDATNRFILPAEFKIVIIHSSSTSTTYVAELQLS